MSFCLSLHGPSGQMTRTRLQRCSSFDNPSAACATCLVVEFWAVGDGPHMEWGVDGLK